MKTKITKAQFLADVRHEIDMLKENTTPLERGRLNFAYFNPEHPEQCIYGQISGDCRNTRAKELMDKCCRRVIDTTPKNINGGDTFTDIKPLINGEYNAQMWDAHGGRSRWVYLSSLEGYIQLENDKANAQIIAYIKGETNGLVL